MIEDLEQVLVKKFVEGDERAFNELVKRHQQNIYWHARRMVGNHLDADEVAQQVIIVLYKSLLLKELIHCNSTFYISHFNNINA